MNENRPSGFRIFSAADVSSGLEVEERFAGRGRPRSTALLFPPCLGRHSRYAAAGDAGQFAERLVTNVRIGADGLDELFDLSGFSWLIRLSQHDEVADFV